MNQIIVILLLFVVLANKNDNLKSLLANLSIEDALPLLQMLGVSEDRLQMINSILPTILNGELDLSTIIKMVIPLISSLNANSNSDLKDSGEQNLSELNQFAPREIVEGMRDYFEK